MSGTAEATKAVRSIISDEVKLGRIDLRGDVSVADQTGAVLLHVVEFSNWAGLVELAEFDPFNLGFRRRPR